MIKKFYLPLLLLPLLLSYSASTGLAGSSGIEFTKKTAENQIRHLLEPLLDKYCHESCRLMNVNVTKNLRMGMTSVPPPHLLNF
jgi:hypothetical protein